MLLPLPLRPTIPKNSPCDDLDAHVVDGVERVELAFAKRMQRPLLERVSLVTRQTEGLVEPRDPDRGRTRGDPPSPSFRLMHSYAHGPDGSNGRRPHLIIAHGMIA